MTARASHMRAAGYLFDRDVAFRALIGKEEVDGGDKIFQCKILVGGKRHIALGAVVNIVGMVPTALFPHINEVACFGRTFLDILCKCWILYEQCFFNFLRLLGLNRIEARHDIISPSVVEGGKNTISNSITDPPHRADDVFKPAVVANIWGPLCIFALSKSFFNEAAYGALFLKPLEPFREGIFVLC